MTKRPDHHASLLRIPQRSPVLTQVADTLRENIQKGTWERFLPAERILANQLQISRPTLRSALAVLEQEGLLKISHGMRSRVTTRSRQPADAVSKVFSVLSIEPLHLIAPSDIFVIGELRRHLQDVGCQLEVHSDARLQRKQPVSILEDLVRQQKIGCWLLLKQTAAVQRWFAAHAQRAIVLGWCYPGVDLPSFDIDFRAVCRHAVGVFLSLGHRQIAFVIPRTGLAGDLAGEEGFAEGFRLGNHADATPIFLRHNGTVEGVRAALGQIVRSRNRPTALLVSHTQDCLTVITHLMHSGLRIPRDISIISRGDEEFLDHVVPSVARYAFNWAEYAQRVSRAVAQLANAGSLSTRPVRVMAEFKKGDTLAPRT